MQFKSEQAHFWYYRGRYFWSNDAEDRITERLLDPMKLDGKLVWIMQVMVSGWNQSSVKASSRLWEFKSLYLHQLYWSC
jgi:hypothetical protein